MIVRVRAATVVVLTSSIWQRVRPARPHVADLIAGISVALVLIPQSLAYAQIADMPVVTGLFASALPLIAAAPLGSSPYLQTGPVALTSLLTFASLQSAGFVSENPDYVAMAGVLALLVGVFRLGLGLARAGWVSYLICEPVMIGFTSAAALIILSSQLPKALGVSELVPETTTLEQALWALTHPEQWQVLALLISAMTLVFMLGGRRFHRLFPGVMVAVILGLVISSAVDYPGLVIGEPTGIPEGMPTLGMSISVEALGALAIGGLVIALVGFAEPSSIARIYAAEDAIPWNANKELIGQGVANITAAVSGGFPVGGSFSRSSINRLAGAKTTWSGGITGVVVLCFLPFAGVLDPLPQAVLGAIVVGAVLGLLQPRKLASMRRRSWMHAGLAWTTFAATLALAPNVQWAVLVGIALSAIAHLLRPLQLVETIRPDGMISVEPQGLLWLASYQRFADELRRAARDHPTSDLMLDLGTDPTVDPGVDAALRTVNGELETDGRSVKLAHLEGNA